MQEREFSGTVERMVLKNQAIRERYEERAAIMEFDAGLPRLEAERMAMAAEWRRLQIGTRV